MASTQAQAAKWEANSASGDPAADMRRRGRGALSNASGRFEPLARQAEDDGWDLTEELPPLKTEITLETAAPYHYAQ